jgi:hypothetical protein
VDILSPPMSQGIAHPGPVTHGAIHYTDRFPVVRTPCGRTRCPCDDDWAQVDCEACLAAGPDTPAVKARLAQVRAERAAKDEVR